MAPPDALYKYVTFSHAKQILQNSSLRWVSPALLNDPWFIGHEANLGFDHLDVNKAMLKTAVSMIFTRDIPKGNREHPLYKAICRWRSEDRFKDETEAWDSLSELLASTPDTLETKLQNLMQAWQEIVANARVACFSETPKNMQSWLYAADSYKGLVLRFEKAGSLAIPQPVEYTHQRQHLTTIREQVNDLVGIERAAVEEQFEGKFLSKSKEFAHEKEWRCLQILAEEDLDCGEDVEDWYLDEDFERETLTAVYLGFDMPKADMMEISKTVKARYRSTAIYIARKVDEQFDVEFEKFNCDTLGEAKTS